MRVVRLFSNCFFAMSFLLPWPLRRLVWNSCYRFEIHRTARIGLSWIRPKSLLMGPGSSIDHFNVIKGLSNVVLGECAMIGRLNWISAFPLDDVTHFAGDVSRDPSLRVGSHSAITHRHIIDCTSLISVGEFSTIAGYRSQFLTHSIDISSSEQRSYPIEIGNFTFVGTNVVLLGGARLPARSVLGAGSVLSKCYEDECMLYGGVPARPIKELDSASAYFHRVRGFVN